MLNENSYYKGGEPVTTTRAKKEVKKQQMSDLKRRHTEMVKKSEEKLQLLSESEDTISEDNPNYDVLKKEYE